jgi:hypothetical protein
MVARSPNVSFRKKKQFETCKILIKPVFNYLRELKAGLLCFIDVTGFSLGPFSKEDLATNLYNFKQGSI